MLTGDKGATARMIGISCGLLVPPGSSPNTKFFQIDEGSLEEVEKKIIEIA